MRPKTCYVHHLPGRLRVRIPAAKGDPVTAEMLAKQIHHLEGISSVTANSVTGSILIHYDTEVTNAAACLAILDVLPVRSHSFDAPFTTRRLTRKIAEAAMWYVVEKTVERCFLLLLAILV